jgi:hypothetical protein
VRTPKKGTLEGRYRARAALPMIEIGLSLLSLCSVVASIQTRHYFATPFAMLFCFGYGYVATLVATEQLRRRREGHSIPPVSEPATAEETPLATDLAALGPGKDS